LIIASDSGPGIRDIPQALRDGFSTSEAWGLGLPGVRALMDELKLPRNGPGNDCDGKKWKQKRTAGGVWGGEVCSPGQGESGDQHLVCCNQSGILVAAIDGIGHGEEAANAAQGAVAILNSGSGRPGHFSATALHEGSAGRAGGLEPGSH